MKQILIALIMLMAMPLFSMADNTLVLQNNTGNGISAAIVWYNQGKQCWESKGWLAIPAYGNYTIQLHDLNLGSNTMYVYAEVGARTWRGTSKFRVDAINAFDILFADQIDTNATCRGFQTVAVTKGQTSFVFNP